MIVGSIVIQIVDTRSLSNTQPTLPLINATRSCGLEEGESNDEAVEV